MRTPKEVIKSLNPEQQSRIKRLMMGDKIARLEARRDNLRRAVKEAEKLLEDKSSQLSKTDEQISKLMADLEAYD
tara:strand:- start:222 stop:446 length:225 start_codon:yes stop_codon:yes gene_type:complete